eukprot:738724-Alexandrium_andersonii.AAC.1
MAMARQVGQSGTVAGQGWAPHGCCPQTPRSSHSATPVRLVPRAEESWSPAPRLQGRRARRICVGGGPAEVMPGGTMRVAQG